MVNRNMNARNFGLKSRNINLAAKNALIEGMESYSSISTMTSRFKQFTKWENETYGVKDLRWVDGKHLRQYAKHIARRVRVGELAVSTAQNYVSAVNRVMELARGDQNVHVNPTDYLPNRTGICTVNKAFTNSEIKKLVISSSGGCLSVNQMAVGRLTVLFNLRFEEASLLDVKKALKEAVNSKSITITKGTKGGRTRCIPVRSSKQLESLQRAAQLQGKGRSLMPVNMNYKQWKSAAYTALKKAGIPGWHGGRHLYAQSLYRYITGVQPPIVAGVPHGISHIRYMANKLNITLQVAKEIDYEARMVIATELGHGRVGITNSYLG